MVNFKFAIICVVIFSLVILAVAVIASYVDSQVNNETVSPVSVVLAETSYGNVTKIGPYGNATSTVKVAYIVGVHPWEQDAHVAAVNAIKKMDKSLKYCYYIYQINVTGGMNSDYETGRMDGQLLAKQYVVPDILENNYQLVMDIHSNKGADDYYDVSWFLYVPYSDNRTEEIANELQNEISGMTFYDPPDPTSPYYVTIPLIKNGTPAIIYEAYEYDSPETRQELADKLLRAIDSLNTINR